MTREELLEKAIYVQFALSGTYKDYGINGVYKIPYHDTNDVYYKWKKNEHHFTTEYHRKYVIPLLCNILGLEYNMNDFIVINKQFEEFDISFLKPKKEYKYEVYGYTRNEHFDCLSFDDITTNNSTKKDITEYHRLYKYGHECSRLINKTTDIERKLFISGDSQLIPDIPFLSCFFKEVWFFDNREKNILKDKYSEHEFSDVLIGLGYGTYNDYMFKNFM